MTSSESKEDLIDVNDLESTCELVTYQRNPHRLENEVAFNLNALMKLSGKSAPYVFRLESVLTLPENAIEAVRNGKLNKTRVQDFLEDIGDS